MNKIMNGYLNHLHDEKENLDAIKTKLVMQKQRKCKMIAIILIIALLGTLSPHMYAKFQQNLVYKEYTRRDYVSGKGEIASAYNEEIQMDYVYQNGIGVKIDSIVLTDDTFKAMVAIKLPEEMKPDSLQKYNSNDSSVQYYFGYAIYDESHNIYDVFDRIDDETMKNGYGKYLRCLTKELGIKENINRLANGGGVTPMEQDAEKIISQIEINSLKGFPNSKKLYIRIFNIGYNLYTKDDTSEFIYPHNNLEWSFEIESPDKFLKRETINLTLLDEIPKLKINQFTVSETGMILKAQKKDIVKAMAAGKDMDNWGEVSDALINITDDNGNIYYPVRGGTTEEKNGFYSRFEIDKDVFEETTLYLNMKIGDEEYTSQISAEK